MALINHVKREINAKLVYFGPAQSGKATNLNVIYKKLNPECRGKLKSMAVQQDRMLFFDFEPPGQGDIDGYRIRFHVYTLAGKVTSDAAWKMVLKGADGVAFIADSAPNKLAANQECLATLRALLQAYGKQLPQIPCVVQYNKRDLAGALSLEELRQTCAAGDAPLVPAVARKGEGVFDVLSRLVQMVIKDLRDSGLEVQSSAAELGGVAGTMSGVMPADAGSKGAEPQSVPAHAEDTPRSVSARPGPTAGGAMPEPVIELAGNPELLGDGRMRLPFVVRCGGGEKKFSLAVSISPEQD